MARKSGRFPCIANWTFVDLLGFRIAGRMVEDGLDRELEWWTGRDRRFLRLEDAY